MDYGSWMRPITVKSRFQLMQEGRDRPNLRLMRVKGKGYLHNSGDGFTQDQQFAWFGVPKQFRALAKKKPWIKQHTWESMKKEHDNGNPN